jgi:hypothetical protein
LFIPEPLQPPFASWINQAISPRGHQGVIPRGPREAPASAAASTPSNRDWRARRKNKRQSPRWTFYDAMSGQNKPGKWQNLPGKHVRAKSDVLKPPFQTFES